MIRAIKKFLRNWKVELQKDRNIQSLLDDLTDPDLLDRFEKDKNKG